MKRIIITEKQLHSIVGNTISEDINKEDNIIELSEEILSDLIENIRYKIEDGLKWDNEYKTIRIDIDNIEGYYFNFIIKVYSNKRQVYWGDYYYNRDEYEYTYNISIEKCTVHQCLNEEEDEWRTGRLSNEQISYIEEELSYKEIDF